MGAVLWLALAYLEPYLMDAGLLVRAIAVFGTIGVAALVYFGFTLATGAIEGRHLMRLLKRNKATA
jgi:putative peptidoglycan lipid II flippase